MDDQFLVAQKQQKLQSWTIVENFQVYVRKRLHHCQVLWFLIPIELWFSSDKKQLCWCLVFHFQPTNNNKIKNFMMDYLLLDWIYVLSEYKKLPQSKKVEDSTQMLLQSLQQSNKCKFLENRSIFRQNFYNEDLHFPNTNSKVQNWLEQLHLKRNWEMGFCFRLNLKVRSSSGKKFGLIKWQKINCMRYRKPSLKLASVFKKNWKSVFPCKFCVTSSALFLFFAACNYSRLVQLFFSSIPF